MRKLLYAALAALLLYGGSLSVSTTASYAQTDTLAVARISQPVIVPRYMQSGFAHSQGRTIDTIVLHSSYNALGGDPYSVSAIIEIYTRLGVSSHYIIDRDGVIYQLVPDNDVSYHCGMSRMPDPDGRTGVNAFSIGIELVGGVNDRFTEPQYVSLQELIVHLKQRYPIGHIVSHGEVAPDRRTDPWNLDWQRVWSW
jgi:N-acetyl-anhydromuramyl-L-alanine amidase AmpD